MPSSNAVNYRPDVDGLRAIAVLAVIAFHAFPEWCAGGFVGVDIFFVISGFLITKLIQEGLNKQTFSISDFYAGRVRRLFPALILVLLASQLFGWFALLSDEYKLLGKHTAASGFLISNWVFWSESGYFDYAANTKPLLHLWSLGLEEQFYLFWPLTLVLAFKYKLNAIRITSVLLLGSLLLNLVMVEKFSAATFFLPFTRMWELLAGSFLALFTSSSFVVSNPIRVQFLQHKWVAQGLSFLGLFLLFISLLFIDQDKRFPGGWAIVPVLGTCLIILAGHKSWFNHSVLSSKILVGTGLISYPLYLWHWPLLSFARILEQGQPDWQIRVLCIAIAFVFSLLTYLFIERPIRFGQHLRTKTYTLMALLLITTIFGLVTYLSEGFRSRFANQLIELQTADLVFNIPTNTDWYCVDASNEGPRCLSSGPDPSTVVMGDSHALTIYAGLVERYQAKGQTIGLYGGGDGCPPLLNVVIQDLGGDTRNCLKKGSQAILRVIKDPAIKEVILTSRGPMYTTGKGFGEVESSQFGTWVLHFDGEDRGLRTNEEVFLRGLADTFDALLAADKKVTFLYDVPELGFDIRSCFTFRPLVMTQKAMDPCAVRKIDFVARTKMHRAGVDSILSARPEIKVIDLAKALCDEEWCFASKNNILFYMDDDHLSLRGAEHVVRQLWDEFD